MSTGNRCVTKFGAVRMICVERAGKPFPVLPEMLLPAIVSMIPFATVT